MAAMWNSSWLGVVVDPALTRTPMSRLRAVMTPSNGATIFSKLWSFSSRRTLAAFELTVPFIAAAPFTAWSVSCVETEPLSRSDCHRWAVISA